jgi:hypothetical protein
MLYRPPGAFLSYLFGDALLVHATVQHCPGDLTRVLALQEERFGFGGVETEDFTVPTDEESAATGVDFTAAEGVELDFHLLR